MSKYTVYADLNCSYSYALHEQLKSLSLLDKVDYRLVEHAPDLGLYGNKPEILAELASDVFAVRSIVNNVPLVLPPQRPDSRLAILCIIAAKQVDEALANVLCDLFYTALWVHGRDISRPSVIFQCIEKAGLPPELEVEEEHENLLELWQRDWANSQVNSRIPAIIAADERKLLGLANSADIQAFFTGDIPPSQSATSASQRASNLHSIAILCTHDIAAIWTTIEALKSDYNILLPASMDELKQLFSSEQNSPDLVLMDAQENWQDLLASYQIFLQRTNQSYTPIAILGAQDNEALELSAYAHGAADYITQKRSAGILKARISMMLDLKKSRDFLERSARIDGLTGINNRREFEKLLEQEWRRSSRTGQSISLIMLDVDFFKPFNDKYGHLAGDATLRSIAATLQESVCRPYDAVCRYGGEEFAIIMPETNISGAKKVAQVLRLAVIELNITHETSAVANIVTVSQGVACFIPSDINSPMLLIEAADKALYQAKITSRNSVFAHGE